MSQQAKSQWDFGELFPTEATRRVLTVSELTAQVRRLLEKQVGQIWVTGEITNLRAQGSGHVYFTLKDASTQLACVLFRGEAAAQRALLQDGQKVVLQGDVTVYEARGQYQLLVRSIELQGVGALQIAFEKLKQKLQAEGLFAPERKRPIPRYPQRIGLVTSPAGAAIRDVLHVIQRRHAGLEILLAPCRVQGHGAAEEIATAIRLLNEFNLQPSTFNLDLILLTRGGGSLEDLWAFNEEAVARAIHESAVPVISAVGHEIDFTIADFVADLRAATPSAAAEIITEGFVASREFVADAAGLMRRQITRRFEADQENLVRTRERLARVHPQLQVNEYFQRLDDLRGSLARGLKQQRRQSLSRWETVRQRLARLRPGQVLLQKREQARQLGERLVARATTGVETAGHRLAKADTRLRLLSPQQVLARGYSITLDAQTRRVIRAADAVWAGQKLKTLVQHGEISSTVEK
ncbi:MAG: exodeoxyribonuclease VII large subunit [Verrucomicrobia bacterium]|nr:exodeoxyribonuclease VII large subunit [Verrucomicrobiota bacterium]